MTGYFGVEVEYAGQEAVPVEHVEEPRLHLPHHAENARVEVPEHEQDPVRRVLQHGAGMLGIEEGMEPVDGFLHRALEEDELEGNLSRTAPNRSARVGTSVRAMNAPTRAADAEAKKRLAAEKIPLMKSHTPAITSRIHRNGVARKSNTAAPTALQMANQK